MKGNPDDPKALIREAYRIEGIDAPQCRSIFLDWALSLPADADQGAALDRLMTEYAQAQPDHPMTRVLGEGRVRISSPRRRGGWRGRKRPQ